MLGLSKHIKLVSILIVSTFVVGSSGLSFVIHTCAMPTEMACCKTMDGGESMTQAGEHQPVREVTLRSDVACMSSTLVGGFTTNPGVVENNQLVHKTPIVPAPPSAFSAIPQLASAVASPHFIAESAPPPSVEKHILNASLLI